MDDCYAPYYNAGYRVYHVRGVYYTNYHASDGEPALLGKEILAEIPKDPAEYSDWKVVMLAFYGNELRRIRRIEQEREEMLREPVWGRHYVSKPTRVLIVSKPFTWAYIVDIDTDRLIVIGCDRSDGYFSVSVFRLNKIPRELFNHPNVFEGSG
ncbi:hypothetical protein DFP73DRAFT_332141 [Morchella snyderi]|nr:hypothetical protein DFP73DRAFT_332141 [Morchella snyderi]